MDSANLALYALAKYIGYSIWCIYGIKLASGKFDIGKGFLLGVARWVIGLLFGVVIFFMFPANSSNLYTLYFLVYVPVRIIEWAIMTLFLPGKLKPLSWSYFVWILGGVVVSFLLDLVSPEWIKEGRFCVGRCLC